VSVLVVEDDAQLASLISSVVLLECGEVHIAATMAEALKKVSERTFNIVLLDLLLPDSFVEETLAKISVFKATGARVVIMTGTFVSVGLLESVKVSGGERVIPKFSLMFHDLIRNVFKKSEANPTTPVVSLASPQNPMKL
jgi:CheY-like chemotaxis protein